MLKVGAPSSACTDLRSRTERLCPWISGPVTWPVLRPGTWLSSSPKPTLVNSTLSRAVTRAVSESVDLQKLYAGSFIDWEAVAASWNKRTVPSRLLLFAARRYLEEGA